jgi:hypothetical protein
MRASVKAGISPAVSSFLLCHGSRMLEIILARHGETDWNVAEVFRGRTDVELNKTGVRQAELLGKYLSDLKIDAVYSSPLKRALKTAEAVAGYHAIKVEIVSGLIDFDYGEWQGLPLREVREKYSELYAAWINCPEQVRMPAGERLEDVKLDTCGITSFGYEGGKFILDKHNDTSFLKPVGKAGLGDF